MDNTADTGFHKLWATGNVKIYENTLIIQKYSCTT